MAGPTPLFDEVDTVVLDVFGTLIDVGSLDLAAAIYPVLKGARILPDQPLEWPDVYEPLDACRKEVYSGPLSTRVFWERYIRFFLEGQGRSYEDVFADSLGMLVTGLALAEYNLYAGAQFLPGAIEAIQEVRRRGYRAVVCSNVNECGLATMIRLGLIAMFDYRDLAISSLIGRQKVPLPREHSIFSWLKFNLGINAFKAVVIEDEVRYAKIARDLGFRTILVGSSNIVEALEVTLARRDVLEAVQALPRVVAS